MSLFSELRKLIGIHSLSGEQGCKDFSSVQNLSLRKYAMSLGVQVGYINYSILWARGAQTGLELLVLLHLPSKFLDYWGAPTLSLENISYKSVQWA